MRRISTALGQLALVMDRLSAVAIMAGAVLFTAHLLWRSVSDNLWFLLLAVPACATALFLIYSFRVNPSLSLMSQRYASGRAVNKAVERTRAGTVRPHPGPY